ncbi:adenosine deaminase [Daldinia sp. FL1419]|nr:adenosine deaminase [Daldinia sp. FL1419]
MCNTSLREFLAALPKVEHHVHLEGSLDPELLFELAAKNNIALPSDDPAFASPECLRERYEHFQNLDDFLNYYYIGMSVLIDEADFEALAYAYFSKAASQNVRHAEVFFDPQAHTCRGVELSGIIGSFSRAQERAAADFGMTTELIMCLLRHLPLSNAVETFSQVIDGGYYANGTLAGVGMDSSEMPYPPSSWTDLYDVAKEWGIRRTIHAGEEGPPLYVTQALDLLDVERIDHGVRALTEGDDTLVARLASSKILLTLCPLSNVRLNCIDSIGSFPLRRLIEAGIRFSINSDDPAYFGGYILENYCALQDTFNLRVEDWGEIARGAVLGSWCTEERKEQLLDEIKGVVGKWSMEPERG